MGLALLGLGGVTSWALGWGAPPSSPADMSPAELVALRFLEIEFAQPMTSGEAAPATVTLASGGEFRPVELSLFDPNPSVPVASTLSDPTPAPVVAMAAPQAAKIPLPVARPTQAPQATQLAHASKPAPVRPTSGRPGSVLNDAQIASIRKRLKLTPDQEEMWPAVEAALRDISYRKTPSGAPRSGSQMAYVDPDSSEVQRLKSAAFPLIMRLNDEQKREVKMLAHVMGLTAVASRL